MDEEDFGAFGIARRKIHTTSQFQDTSDSNTGKRKYPELDSVIPGEAPLKELVRPVKESIGMEILKKLGWKLGQGIGPRVKKQPGAPKTYGCSLPNAVAMEEDDPYALSFTFAPGDVDAEIYTPKDNVFGLGYTGLSKESVLSAHVDLFNPTSTKSFLKKDKKKLTISGQAFGVGAFEDDDEDIYSKDDMSQYDFSELNPKESFQTAQDGPNIPHPSLNMVIAGFCLATQPPPCKKYYPPPELPPNYKPFHFSIPKISTGTEPRFAPRHSMSADGRSLLLGEKKFQPFKMNSNKNEKMPDFLVKQTLPTVSNKIHTFRPFPNDELKQKRYEDYLKLKNLGEEDKLIQPSSMTEWEKQQECEEFSRASVLFKPISSALSSKFESKSHLDVEHEVMDALAKAKEENDRESLKVNKKLVGLSDRKTIEWHPASLLCRRMNVPNPYPNSDAPGLQNSKSLFDHLSSKNICVNKSDVASNLTQETSSTEKVTHEVLDEHIPTSSVIPMDIATDKDNQVQLSENKRPPIDFFKDIFENSSSEDEDTKSKTDTLVELPISTSKTFSGNELETGDDLTSSKSTNNSAVQKCSTDNKKVGFGVFANLDLDALNRRTPIKPTNTPDMNETKDNMIGTETNDIANVKESNSSISPDLYGPELPPNYTEPPQLHTSKLEHKKHSKHKVRHKHKHHKHKSKKKKKRKNYKSSDDSSISSDVDIPPTVILDKLKKLQKLINTDM